MMQDNIVLPMIFKNTPISNVALPIPGLNEAKQRLFSDSSAANSTRIGESILATILVTFWYENNFPHWIV